MNPPTFTCVYQNHNDHPIIKFCLYDNCKSKIYKLCEMCQVEYHQDHQLDCFPITFLYYILEIQLKKLEEILKQTQSLSTQNQCNSFYQELITYQDIFKKFIQNQYDDMHLYDDIKNLIQFARQCYNNEIQKLLIAFVNTQTIGINAKNTIIQIIQQVYLFDDLQYLLFIITQQIENLLQLCKYDLALQKVNFALKLKQDCILLAKKYSILIIMGKHQEANELITYHDNYNFDDVLQGNVISLVNYHHYKRQHQNDDRFNMQLFLSFSLLDQGKLEEANKILKAELIKKPESLDIIMCYVKFLVLYQNNIDKALKFCKKGMENYPNCQAYSDAKFICMLMQDPKQYHFDNLQNLDDDTKITYSIILIKQGEFQKAIEYLKTIERTSKKYSETQSFIFIATKLFSKNKQTFSIQSYEQNRQVNSPLIVFISELKQFFLEKKFESALEIIEQKLLKIPQSLFLTLLKSISLIALQNYGLAQQYLESLRVQYPNEPIIEICYAFCLIGLQKYQSALEIMNNQPWDGERQEFLEVKGYILLHQGQITDSINCYKQLASNKTNKSITNLYLGMIYQMQKQFTMAIYYYDLALQNETNKQQLLYNKALAILENNISQKLQPNDQSFKDAKNIFQSLIDVYDSKWLLVILNYLQNNFNEAHNLLEILKQDSQNIENAYKLQGTIYYKQQLFGNLVNIYQKLNITSLTKTEISQFIISAILTKNFALADSLINTCQQQLQSLFYIFKGFLMEQEGKYVESCQYYEEFCSQEQSNQAIIEYPNVIQTVKLAQRQIFIRLQQNQKVIELENRIKQDYPNLSLNSNYQQLLMKDFEILNYESKPILSQLETINFNLLLDFSKWCKLIDKYDSMNIYQFELMFKQ